MANREAAGQRFHEPGRSEIIAHIAKTARRVEAVFGIICLNAARFLPAMLQRMEPESDEIGGLLNTNHAENAALLLELIAVHIERMGCDGAGGVSLRVGQAGGRRIGMGHGQAPNLCSRRL